LLVFIQPNLINFRGVLAIRHFRRLRGYGFLLDAGIVLTLYSIGSGAAWFLLPQIIQAITQNLTLVGILIAIPGLTAMLVDAPVGDLADKVGRKKIVIIGLTTLILLATTIVFVKTTLTLIIFLLLLGVAYPTVFYPLITYMMDHVKNENCSKVMGVGMSFSQLGFAIGPILAGTIFYLVKYSNQTILALIYSTAGFLALIAAILLLKERKNACNLFQGIKQVIFVDKLFLKELTDFSKLSGHGLPIIFATLLISIYDGVAWMLEPLFYGTVTDNALWGGLILSAFVIPLVIFEAPAGYLADKYGRKNILYSGFFIAGLMTWLFAYSKNPLEMFSFAFTASIGIAMAWPALEGILAKQSPSDQKGEIVGVWGSSLDLGYVIGPVLAGIVAAQTSIQFTFKLLGIVLIATSLIAFTINVFKKK